MSMTAIVDTFCAIFIGIVLARYNSEHSTIKSSRLLNICLVVMLLTLVDDAMAYSFIGPSFPVALRYPINLLSFLAASIMAFAYTLYAEELFREKGFSKLWLFRVLKALVIVWFLATAYEFVAGNLITYDASGVEDLSYSIPIYITMLEMVFLVAMPAVTIVNARRIGARQTVLMCVFNVVPIFSSLIYSVFGLDCAYAFAAVTLVLVAEFAQKRQIESLEEELALQQEMEREHDLLAQNNARMFALQDDFMSLYDVELESGYYVSFDRDEFYRRNISDKFVSQTEFFTDLRTNIDRVIYVDDREGVFAFANREAIISGLAERDHLDHYYRLITENGPLWVKMRIVYKDAERRSIIVGVLNAEEEMTIREKEAELLQSKELELRHSEFRASALAYMTDHEEDVTSFLSFFAAKLRELIGCDEVIYLDVEGKLFIENAPELGDGFEIPHELCENCAHYDIFAPVYASGVAEMSDARVGANGILAHKDCPVKSALTRIVYLDGKVNGYLAIHYILDYHEFSDYERQTLEEFTNLLSLTLSRYAAREKNAQLSEELELKHQVEEQKEQLERDMRMIGGVASGYNALYYINIDEDVLHIYALDEAKYPGSRAIFEGDEPDFYKIIGGYGLSEQVHPDDRHLFEGFGPDWLRQVLTGRKKYSMRFRAATEDGYRWDEMELTKYEGIDEVANAVAVGFTDRDADIRKEQEYQQQLEVAREEADAANKSKSDFLFSMSHDIRTPMNAITGFTAMAKKYADDGEKVGDYLDKIDVSGKQLLSLVNQVLEMARIESGQIELDEKPVNVQWEFDAMATVLSEQAQVNGLKLTCSLEDVEHFNVLADESRMSSITLNITGNAMKYTPEGGSIDFILREIPARKPGYATFTFTVADTGIGMSEEFQKVLFEPFTREESSTVSKIQGTGLGLPIVKKIVDLMGGEIEVHSELGVGTRFDITVDFRINEDAGVETVEPTMDLLVSFRGLRVLLVEDNELNREIALDILEEEGLLAEEAEDGSEAVEILRTKGPDYYDFILMDIQMPKMDGYKATRAIREMYPDAQLPIIALSANAFAEDKAKSLAAGMDDHVAKPIDINELFSALAKFL